MPQPNDTRLTERESAVHQLRRSEAYLAESQRLTKTGSWAWTPGKDEWNYWSDEMFRIFEFNPQDGPPTVEMSRQRIHPEDREAVSEKSKNVLRNKAEYLNDYRLLLPDGRIKHLHVIGHPVFDDAGEITEFVGTSVDVTEQKRTEEALRRSEVYLVEAQKLSHTGSFGWDTASGEIYWSPETFRIFELEPTEKVTIDLIRQRTHPEDRIPVRQLLQHAVAQRTAFDFEHRLLMPDGSVKYVHIVGRPSQDGSSPSEFVGAVTDVSEHRLAEHVLRRSDGYLKETQRLNRIGSWAFTLPSRKPNYWSDELFRIWGFDPKDGAPDDRTMLQRVHPDDRENVRQYLELLLAGGVKSDTEGEHRIVLPDGTVKHVHGIVHPVCDEAGHVVEYVGSLVDVTERKRAEEALRRSEAYLREAQKLSQTGSWALRPGATKSHYWSEEMFRIYGCNPRQENPDWRFSMEQIHPEDRDRAWQELEVVVEGRLKNDDEREYRIFMPDGTTKYIHGTVHPVFDQAGNVVEYIGTDVDVTERKRAEEALRRSEAYLAEAQKLSHTGSWALDPFAGKLIYYSEEMFRIMGLEPALDPPHGELLSQRTHPDDIPRIIEDMTRIRAAAEKSRIVADRTDALVNELRDPKSPVGGDFELRVFWPDGTLRYIRSYGHPVFDKAGQITEFVGTAIDVTEQKKAELERERLRQLEADLAHINRVSMMGELSVSLAHELKQPIAAGIISARTVLNWLSQDQPNVEEACQAATNAVKAGERAAGIIDRLRALYTKAPPKREVLDGNGIIRDMVALLWLEANRYKVSISTDLAAEVPLVWADRVQLQQVLMNLMLNAIEAMKETGGSLSVRSALNREGVLQISVGDTGPGLPATKEDQIFEPFFTTKPHGSGMGLAICRSIVESHGGRLWADANGDRGACFHFTLPVAHQSEN